jgi:hypothetical protein
VRSGRGGSLRGCMGVHCFVHLLLSHGVGVGERGECSRAGSVRCLDLRAHLEVLGM